MKTATQKELLLLSGDFFLVDLPQNRRFLLNYFRRGVQRQFLFYFYSFESYRYFQDHTGYICSIRWLKKLKKKYRMLERLYDKLKSEITDTNLSLAAQLETGKLKYDYEKFKQLLGS